MNKGITLALGGMLVSASVFAGNAEKNSFYVGVAGGINIPSDIDIQRTTLVPPQPPFSRTLRIAMDTNAAGNLVLGYRILDNLSVEGEYTYRNNKSKSVNIIGIGSTINRYKQIMNSVMANAIYTFDLSSSIHPYLGAGLGLAHVNLRNWDSLGTGSDSHTHFAYQGIVGASLSVSDKAAFYLQYQFIQVTKHNYSLVTAIGNQSNTWAFNKALNNHSIMLGFRYSFHR